ncbi:MAG: glycosyltransferase family 2 protein [Candidatus Brocadiales bacterium]
MENTARNNPSLSVVIPLYNEEGSVGELYQRLKKVLDGLGKEVVGPPPTYEILFVNDGSTDRTGEILKGLYEKDERIKVIELRTNFGKASALSAGFDHARGDIVLSMDGDLQDLPEEIPLFIKKMNEGYDVVSGWRQQRDIPFFTRKLPSRVANWMIAKVTGVNLHDFGNAYKAYRKEVIRDVRIYGDHHRFIPALAKRMGVSIAEIPVRNEPRRYGQSKYGLERIYKVFFDIITVKFLMSYSTRPMHILGPIGSFFGLVGIFLGMRLAYLKIMYGDKLGTKVSLSVCVLCILLAVQIITSGLLAELLVRIYHESQAKPIYVIKQILEHGPS